MGGQSLILMFGVEMVSAEATRLLHPTSYSGGINYGLQLQFWPCPESINVPVTALDGIPRRTNELPYPKPTHSGKFLGN